MKLSSGECPRISLVISQCVFYIINSEVWSTYHCSGLGHETVVCALCLSILFLVQVMDWCRQATNHYPSQCWSKNVSPNGFTGPRVYKLRSGQNCCHFTDDISKSIRRKKHAEKIICSLFRRALLAEFRSGTKILLESMLVNTTSIRIDVMRQFARDMPTYARVHIADIYTYDASAFRNAFANVMRANMIICT